MNLRLLIIIFLGLTYGMYGQVGIGTALPNQSTQLDVVASDRGVMIPRVKLTGILDENTIVNGNEQSLLVFNLTNNTLIKPGYYYWFENSWKKIISTGDIETDFQETLTTLVYNNVDHTLIYRDEKAIETIIDFQPIISQLETVTTLIDNADGTITYTNENNIPVTINLASGAQGSVGQNGADGTNGTNGATPVIGANGNWEINGSDTGIAAKGDKGADGTNGTNGADGANGTNGATPVIGANGNWEIDGTDTGIA